MRINTNISSLAAFNAMSQVNRKIAGSTERLATGLRINSAADDAAGLAISEKMRAQAHGLDQASRNAQDGISMIQTAEGALSETHSILQRMRELSVQAANDTLTAEDRAYIQLEVGQLRDEIDRIALTTQFNKKKLLDGSASAVWSSDRLSTKATVRGGLTGADPFGQKISAEGNYKIEITADPGEAEIWKSNIMTEKYNSFIHIAPGQYEDNAEVLAVTDAEDLTDALFSGSGIKNVVIDTANTVLGAGGGYDSAATFSGMGALGLDSGIILSTGRAMDIMGANTTDDHGGSDNGTGVSDADLQAISGQTISDASRLEFDVEVEENVFALVFEYVFASEEYLEFVGSMYNDTFGFFVNGENVALTPGTNAPVTINSIHPDVVNGSGTFPAVNGDLYVDNTGGTQFIFDGHTKTLTAVVAVNPGSLNHVKLVIGDGGDTSLDSSVLVSMRAVSDADTMIKTKPANPGKAVGEIVSQTDAMNYPATLEITQGDGKTATVTIYEYDTMDEIARKLNDAVSAGLGQGGFLSQTPGADQFATYVDAAPTPQLTVINNQDGSTDVFIDYEYPPQGLGIESVPGTFILRSAIPGMDGKLYFSGDEHLLNLLGLARIQEARESEFTVSVHDAHSGEQVGRSQTITGSMFYDAIGRGSVDVRFDPLADIGVTWNEAEMRFSFKNADGVYTTFVHLADSTTVLQTGANEGEDFALHLGDMSASALGLDGLLVISRETAARAVTILDGAIGRVSRQRAALGAYQNRLEHTLANLTASHTNLIASESRIRDADMAKEMMDFTRLNVLQQSGVSMIAQANQLPQAALSLLRT